MKWNNVAILVLSKIDFAVETTVFNCLRNYPSSYLVSKYPPEKGSALKNVELAVGGILTSKLTLFSKLIIVAHGTHDTCGLYFPGLLAVYLNYLGVRKVGLISFKVCSIGEGLFLETFAHECIKYNIEFGWCLGYRGSVHSYRNHLALCDSTMDNILRLVSFGQLKLSDDQRVKVVRGAALLPDPFCAKLGRRFANK
ncbi:hypothetical protein [Enterobacter sp. Bisph1]|uniref:hypothetical protein n=1 Tax=Enterobacter sp. Bisph1 TaxID=1274399 RepID=UPI00057C0035|nr:hypothetical protein [Enterobacter sp. Bisph1]